MVPQLPGGRARSPKRIVPVVLILGLGGYALWRFVLAPPADAAGLVASGTVEATDAQLLGAIEAALERGESPSRTAKAVAADFGVPKRRVYDLVLSLGGDR